MSKTIVVDGIEYNPKSEAKHETEVSFKSLKYVIIRTYSAGVFTGYLQKKIGQNAIILKARRLWYWFGAASLSQLAVDGLNDPEGKSKFPCEVDEIELDQVIEVLAVSKKAQESIAGVPNWVM